jgi:hypothetical protein
MKLGQMRLAQNTHIQPIFLLEVFAHKMCFKNRRAPVFIPLYMRSLFLLHFLASIFCKMTARASFSLEIYEQPALPGRTAGGII